MRIANLKFGSGWRVVNVFALVVGANFLITSGFAQDSSSSTSPPTTSALISPADAQSEPAEVSSRAIVRDDTNSADASANTPSITVLPETAVKSTRNNLAADSLVDPASLIPDLPPVPRAKATLIGGTVEKLDRVRDQITVSVFGGGRIKVLFDPRTRIYKSGAEATLADLRPGDRIYLDTILDGTTVFARNIRVKASATLGESRGVVVGYNAKRGELTVRDAISPSPMVVRVTSLTKITQDGQPTSLAVLMSGAMVALRFDASGSGSGKDTAREISVLALPGADFTFVGQVMHIDLRTGLLVLNSSTDHKTYEIYLDPNSVPEENLLTGAMVTVLTKYDGTKYMVGKVTVSEQAK